MSYEQFKKDVKATAQIMNRDALEHLDHALQTDEQLLTTVEHVAEMLKTVAAALETDAKQYRTRLNQKS